VSLIELVSYLPLTVSSGRFLKNSSAIFRARGSGQWGRCCVVWYTVLRYVKLERAVSSILWSADAHSLEFSSSYQDKISINLDNFIQNKVEASKQLQENLHSLFPRAFPREKLKDLRVSSFSDNPDALVSLFERPDNKLLLKPLIEELASCLLALTEEEMIQTLQNSQAFLQTLVRCLYGPNGVPPRAWQTAMFQHAPVLKYPRNLYIIDDMVCLGNPRAKQVHRDNYPAWWALTEGVGLPLLIFIGVFRPVEVNLALRLKPKRAPDEMRHFIFTRPYTQAIHKMSILWTGKMVNKALYSVESNLQAEARVHRHVMKAFLKKHLQQELGTLLVDDQESTRPQQLGLSKIIHGFFGLATETGLTEAIPQTGAISASNLRQSDIDFARLVARYLVASKYDLTGPIEKVKAKAGSLHECLPFLYGPGKPWEQLGDEVLVEVTTTLIYGGSQPALLTHPPYHGYSTDVVATAVTLVSSPR